MKKVDVKVEHQETEREKSSSKMSIFTSKFLFYIFLMQLDLISAIYCQFFFIFLRVKSKSEVSLCVSSCSYTAEVDLMWQKKKNQTHFKPSVKKKSSSSSVRVPARRRPAGLLLPRSPKSRSDGWRSRKREGGDGEDVRDVSGGWMKLDVRYPLWISASPPERVIVTRGPSGLPVTKR